MDDCYTHATTLSVSNQRHAQLRMLIFRKNFLCTLFTSSDDKTNTAEQVVITLCCSDGQIKSWFDLNHDSITNDDLIWLLKIWFENTWFYLELIWILSWFDLILFDLWFEQMTSFCGLSYIIVNEYGLVNNRFFMDILPKYVASFLGNSGTWRLGGLLVERRTSVS